MKKKKRKKKKLPPLKNNILNYDLKGQSIPVLPFFLFF